jgi:hypothetical protein
MPWMAFSRGNEMLGFMISEPTLIFLLGTGMMFAAARIRRR